MAGDGQMSAPLSGLRVVDLTRYLAGAYTTMILGDLGAEILKIENPEGGDGSREVGPFVNGVSTYFLSVNRGKKSIAVDLKHPAGREIVLDLIATADVVVENFVPGTVDRLGIGFEDSKKRNARVIYASCSGFGQTGPFAEKRAFDMLIQGMAGTISITGEPDRPPVRVGFSIGDIAAAQFLATGILAALHRRDRDGKAQRVEVGMLDCQLALLENAFSRYLNAGEKPQREGRRHPVATPMQVIATQDGYMCLAVGNDQQWHRFCVALQRPELAEDARFLTNKDRTRNRDQLENLLVEILVTRPTDDWVALLERHGVPAGPVNTIDRVARHPQVVARDMIVALEHPRTGRFRVVNTPIRIEGRSARPSIAAPDLGEHTEDVLKNVLHLADERIAQLLAQRAVAPASAEQD